MELFYALLLIDFHIILFAFAYRNRRAIGQWLNWPYYAEDDREVRLRRTKEDAERELSWIEANKK